MFLKLLFHSSCFIVVVGTPITIASYYIQNEMKQDRSEEKTAYAYYIPFIYFTLYQIGVTYLWVIMVWFAYAADYQSLFTLIRGIWDQHVRLSYPIIFVNEISSFVIAFAGVFDQKLLLYTRMQLFFYAAAFFICNHIYQLYSRNILRRNDIASLPLFDRRVFFFYEYVFYFQTLVIFVCFYYSIKFDELHISLKPLIKFLINNLMFHIFEITKIYLIVNVFILTQFLQVIIDGVDLILNYKDSSYLIIGITITSIVLAFAYNLHILGQYYMQLRNCRGIIDNPPQQIPQNNDFLREEDVEKLEVKTFTSDIERRQQRTEAIDLAQLEDRNSNTLQCSVCGNDFVKKDKIIILQCSHLFHSECLIPWLKLKNSCPNCRTQVPRINH